MRVLCDYAHADLWESLEILFTDRFGWELYRPIGMEWYHEGFWAFERQRLGDQVARQFLQEHAGDLVVADGSMRHEPSHPDRAIKMVTLEQARAQEWDIVIATLAENEAGLYRFARERGAAYGIQIGNQGAPNNFGQAAFVMSSVTLPQVPKLWMPHVFYHQEFSLADFAPNRYTPDYPPVVMTRVQCITETSEYARFAGLAAKAPFAAWRHHGHCGEHDALWGGNAETTAQVAREMARATVAYHAKRWSDGYGHVLHNWFALGVPLLATSGYYTGEDDGVAKLAAPLFIDGETSFDIDLRPDSEVVELVRRLVEDIDYQQAIHENMIQRFAEVVNFDAEAAEIRTMLDGVLSARVSA